MNFENRFEKRNVEIPSPVEKLVKERNSWIARDLSSWPVVSSMLEISNQLDKLPDINSSFSPRDAIMYYIIAQLQRELKKMTKNLFD